jgi:hypothetical protein
MSPQTTLSVTHCERVVGPERGPGHHGQSAQRLFREDVLLKHGVGATGGGSKGPAGEAAQITGHARFQDE